MEQIILVTSDKSVLFKYRGYMPTDKAFSSFDPDQIALIKEQILKEEKTVLIVSILSKEFVLEAERLLVEFKDLLQEKKIFCICFTGFYQAQIISKFEKAGVIDFIKPQFSKTQVQRIINSAFLKYRFVQQGKPKSVEFLPSIEIPFNIWTIESPASVVYLAKLWSVKLLGPGPNYGGWVESNPGVFLWHTDNSISIPEFDPDVIWEFRGANAPQFENKQWIFIGPEITLTAIKGNQKWKRIYPYADKLCITKNSEKTLKSISEIAKTFLPQEELSKNFEYYKNFGSVEKFGELYLIKQEGESGKVVLEPIEYETQSVNIKKIENYSNIDSKIKSETNTNSAQVDLKPESLTTTQLISEKKNDSETNAFLEEFESSGDFDQPNIFFDKYNKNHGRVLLFENFKKTPYFSPPPSSNLFNLIKSQNEIDLRIKESIDSNAPAMFWTRNRNTKLFTKVKRTETGIISVAEKDKIKMHNLITEAKKNNLKNIFLKISLQRGVVCSVLDLDNLLVTRTDFIVPSINKIYEVQRRNHFRLPLFPYKNIQAEIETQNHEKALGKFLNISLGGAAILVDNNLNLKKNDTINARLDKIINGVVVPARVIDSSLNRRNDAKEKYQVRVVFQKSEINFDEQLREFIFQSAVNYIETYLSSISSNT